ncbi:MAG: glycosyltransferase family 4 protein [Bdellovibrionales bacterium]|nr:glycosyltransferase family 4 protein [Bdellovibrionales bacterium]
MIGILHGYLLEGSGSNIWTRNICEALARAGIPAALICQERHPERYPFIETSTVHGATGKSVEARKDTPYPGKIALHRPEIGKTLPVFVRDKYEGFDKVTPIIELSDKRLEAYVERHVEVLSSLVKRHGITTLLANHAVLMPTVAQRVHKKTGIAYSVVPHGSAIEYAVRLDGRLHAMAAAALTHATHVFCVSEEMKTRLQQLFASVPKLSGKFRPISVGVDTRLFKLVPENERQSAKSALGKLFKELPAGKTRQQRELSDSLSDDSSYENYTTIVKKAGQYSVKGVDTDASSAIQDIPSGPTLLFVGRLIAAKGPQCLFWALPHLFNVVPELRIVIAGQGPLREPLECYLSALQRGEQSLAENILHWGVPGEPANPYFKASRDFLDKMSEADRTKYFTLGRKIPQDRVTFTGLLGHRELAALYPLCDVAVFPSLVPEAGPMVFLEAMASGCFPMGTNIAGIRNKIDLMQTEIPPALATLARLDPDNLVGDLTTKLPPLLRSAPPHKEALRRIAVRNFDWMQIATSLSTILTPDTNS